MTIQFGLLAFLNWNNDWNNWHFPDALIDKAAQQIRELGVDMVRTDVVWSDVHCGAGQYDFARYDRLLAKLHEHGINLLIVLHYNKERLDIHGNEIWNRPPDSLDEFARYVETAVRRYKHLVHTWEIWNEPNHPVYWNAPPDQLKLYSRLFELSYHAAKNADPACTVINGGITAEVAQDVRYFYDNGGGKLTDKLNMHMFLDPLAVNSLQTLSEVIQQVSGVMAEFGDDHKKIWITEIGCPGVINPAQTKPWWIGRNTTEEEQSEWLDKVFTMAGAFPSVEKVFWAFYRDTGMFFKDGVDYFGLVRNDFTPKPAFYRLKSLIGQ